MVVLCNIQQIHNTSPRIFSFISTFNLNNVDARKRGTNMCDAETKTFLPSN